MKRHSLYGLYLVFLFGILAGISAAQAPPATGTPAFGSFGGGPFDTVNLGNLDVHFAVPIFHKAGRGLPFNYDLDYDSSVWSPVGTSGNQTWTPVANWGWTPSMFGTTGYITYTQTIAYCGTYPNYTGTHVTISNWVYFEPLGTRHPFTGEFDIYSGGCTGTTVNSFTSTATDGSGLILNANTVANTITTPAGAILYPVLNPGGAPAATTITDANGNKITTDSSGNLFDTLSSTTPTLTVAGTPPTVTLKYTAPTGSLAPYTINYGLYNVHTAFGCPNVVDPTINGVYLVNSITLPDGTSYSFTYEQTLGSGNSGYKTGRLQSVTLPTGGSITYTYSGGSGDLNHNAITCVDGSTAGLSRTVSPSFVWGYSRTGSGNAWTTTVTDPTTAGNQTVISFQKDSATTNPTSNFYETQRLAYQGSSASGTLFATNITCYNGNGVSSPSSCSTTAVASPILRTTAFSYLPSSSGVEAETDSTYDIFDLIHDVYNYDFGNAPVVGPLLRHTNTTYVGGMTNGIVDRPYQVTIYDGGGTLKAQTTYTYDEPGTLTGISGTPQHISITGSRGNLTTVAAQANSTTTLYRKFTYYDTGMLNTSTGVSTSSTTPGSTTTYNYASGTASCGNSFVTSITEPLSLSRSMTWDCNGGVTTSLTDENTQTSTTYYTLSNFGKSADPNFWRPYATTDQLVNPTTFTYSNPNQVESTLLFNSSNSVNDVLTTVDGFGRTIFTQTKQGPSATMFDTVATCYDNVGRTSFVSLPYSAVAATSTTSCPASAGTTTTYDALSRPSGVTDSGGGSTTYSYPANDVYQTISAPTGENAKRKQSEYDVLGRLTSVCEVTNASGYGTCAQKSSPQPNGYWTEYNYDPLGDLILVTQNAQVSGSQQTRTYAFDLLGRMTSEKNPEMNNVATTYTYDSVNSGNCVVSNAGDLVMRVDAAGNGSCYAHDSIHRVLSIGQSYNGSPNASVTADRCYFYDSATVNGASMSNAKGHLAEAYTVTQGTGCGAAKITDEGFSYSVRGELTDLYESTPNSGGYYHTTASYFANGALNILSGVPGQTAWTYGVEGEGRPYSAVQGSTNLVSSVTYNPASQPGVISFGVDSDHYTYDANTGRMNNFTFTVGTAPQSLIGNLTWNPNGSLRQLQITDQFNAGGTQTCNYGTASTAGYDDLGRLVSADCGVSTWQQNFSYDPFGNLTKTVPLGSTGFSWTPGYDQTTNRYTLSGTSYDSNGNLLNDMFHTQAWNAENHMVKIGSTCGGSSTVCVTYDAFNRIAEKQVGSVYKQILYSPLGKTAVMNGQTLVNTYLPLPGGATLYETPGQKNFWHNDWLGTARLSSNSAHSIVYDRAFAPFGEQYSTFGTASGLSFTGDTQDTFIVSGTTPLPYDTPNREQHPVQGRWLSPDPAGLAAVDPTNPQTWNRYAYVGNNPLNNVDPLGLELESPWGVPSPLPGEEDGCNPAYAFCQAGICSYFPVVCDHPGPSGGDGGGGGGGGSSSAGPGGGGQRVGGRYGDVNNETLGLPPGINFKALSLGDLFGLNPNGPCDFGVCASVGGNSLLGGGIPGGMTLDLTQLPSVAFFALKFSLQSSNCLIPNPVTGIAELVGSWGKIGGCVLNDQLMEPPGGACVKTATGLHCYQFPSGNGCTTMECPGPSRGINGSCSGFTEPFPIKSTTGCVGPPIGPK